MSSTRPLVLVASLVSAGLAVASTAHAQAVDGPPGACACPVPAAPVAAPAPALPRWSVGVHMTSLGLAPEDAPEGTEPTQYAGGGLQIAYRLRPRWQLALSLDHVREKLEDDTDGDRHLQSVTLAALYHFNPYARWDWYVLGGVGATADGDPALSDEAREATQVAHVHLGVGLERHFRRIGIAAELRVVGIAPAEVEAGGDGPKEPSPSTPMVGTQEIEARGLSGGQLTIAASYYF